MQIASFPALHTVYLGAAIRAAEGIAMSRFGLDEDDLMARAGLFLPCSGTPRLPWCGQVLADIGDEQSLQQNLSTFSGHIRRIARILDRGGPPATSGDAARIPAATPGR